MVLQHKNWLRAKETEISAARTLRYVTLRFYNTIIGWQILQQEGLIWKMTIKLETKLWLKLFSDKQMPALYVDFCHC